MNFFSRPPLSQSQTADLVKVSENIYAFIPPNPLKDYVDGNSVVIITSEGLVVIDTRTDTKCALEEIGEIKKLSPLPVKYIINTHWHYDHILGNEAFKNAWPEATIIAHSNCLKQMEENVPAALQLEPGASNDLIKQFRAELETGIGADSLPLIDYDKLRHRQTIADLEDYISHPIPKYIKPDITFDSSLTIALGGENIHISHWGNGHTTGDAMVWLPEKKILVTGDNVVAPVPYSLGNYVQGQLEILEKIKTADADIIIPGHGPVQYDKTYISIVIDLFRSAESKVKDCYSKNMSVEECIKFVHFDEFRDKFVTGDESAYAFKNYFALPVIRAIYKNELNKK